MSNPEQAHLHLCWVFHQLQWVAHTEGETLYVDDRVYRRYLKEHLASQGIKWKSQTEYMQPAEDAWRRQCEAEKALQADLAFWRFLPGVLMVPRQKETEADGETLAHHEKP